MTPGSRKLLVARERREMALIIVMKMQSQGGFCASAWSQSLGHAQVQH